MQIRKHYVCQGHIDEKLAAVKAADAKATAEAKVAAAEAAERRVYDKSLEANREVGTGPILMQRT